MPTDQQQSAVAVLNDQPARPLTRFRWVILSLLFVGTMINYIDRSVLSQIAPQVQKQYDINDRHYGRIMAAFSFCYAAGQLVAGSWLDRVGSRLGYGLAVALWSLCSIAHGFVRSALGFGVCRGLLGLTESPAYPAAIKISTEWFPRRERALAMGFVNGGASVGTIIVPIIVLIVVPKFGLASAFIVTGSLGLVLLAFWVPIFRRPQEHKRVSPTELDYILSDQAEGTVKIPWLSLLRHRQAWAFIGSKFLTDSIFSFLLFFAVKFFSKQYHLSLSGAGAPAATIYLMAGVGSIFGGWISSRLLKAGWSLNAARKTTLLICALCVVPVAFATFVPLWPAVLLVGFALAAHQGFSANQYALISDMFPRRVTGSVAGIGGSCGYLGTTLLLLTAGEILQRTHGNYRALFIIAGCGYVLAFAIIQLLAPRLEPAQIPGDPSSDRRAREQA